MSSSLHARATVKAQELLCQHEAGRSWRVICKEDYDGAFSHTVLRNLACDGIIPKDRSILLRLGLIEQKPPDPPWLKRRKKAIARMAKETREAMEVKVNV